MCNLYNLTTTTEAMAKLNATWRDQARNMPPLYGVYPDYFAPIVHDSDRGRVMRLARWDLPSLKDAPTNKPNRGTTNIRHPWFDDWKGYLGPENRCLVPFNRFSEPTKLPDGKSGNAWFAFGEEAPVSFFAGLWTSWDGTRRKDEGPMRTTCSRSLRRRRTARLEQSIAWWPITRSSRFSSPLRPALCRKRMQSPRDFQRTRPPRWRRSAASARTKSMRSILSCSSRHTAKRWRCSPPIPRAATTTCLEALRESSCQPSQSILRWCRE